MKRFGIAPLAVAAALALLALGAYAVGNITTDQASTAAPTTVNLAGVAAAAGSSFSFAKADHVHSITGALPAVNVSKDATLAGTTTLGIDLTHANTWTGIETFTATASQANPILTPQTSDPSAPSAGGLWVAGLTTAMTLRGNLNGVKSSFFSNSGAVNSVVEGSVAGCTTAAAALASCTVTVTWTSTMIDTAYKVACLCDGIASGVPIVQAATAKTTTTATIQVVALNASAAACTTVDCAAFR